MQFSQGQNKSEPPKGCYRASARECRARLIEHVAITELFLLSKCFAVSYRPSHEYSRKLRLLLSLGVTSSGLTTSSLNYTYGRVFKLQEGFVFKGFRIVLRLGKKKKVRFDT